MSVCRKLPDGTIQKIAGHTILLDANASEVREGTITIDISGPTPNQYSGTVTFSDPMPDADYAIVLNVASWNKDGNIFGTPWRIISKTTTGFTITGWKADTSQTTQIAFEYFAWKPVKIDGYTALQNKVNNPDETPTIDSMNLVTSDGVARAIENASAVWKGTKAEWNALPAAEKQTYDLAVLLDTTLVKAVDREDGTETDVANLNKIWRGTQAAWDALTPTQKDEYDQAEVIDEYTGVPVVVDKVESGNLNPVTSNAVAECFRESSGTATLTSFPTAGQINWYRVGRVVHVDCATLSIPAQTHDTILATGLPRSPRPMNGTLAYIGEASPAGFAKPVCVLPDGSLITNGGTAPAGTMHGGFSYITVE